MGCLRMRENDEFPGESAVDVISLRLKRPNICMRGGSGKTFTRTTPQLRREM